MKEWTKYKFGQTVGQTGSENGVIINDEEFDESCRITHESCEEYHAITCGIYGAMVHTVFCSPEDVTRVYESMKRDLEEFMSKDTAEDEEIEFYYEFTMKY